MIDFPASPTDGQIFSATNGVVYKYSATYTSWLAQNAAPPLGGTGDFYAYANTSVSSFGPGSAVIIPNTVLTGNAGVWYSTSTGRYTPPAGRYLIVAGAIFTDLGPGGSNASIQIRKNGAAIGVGRETADGGHVLAATGYFGDPQGTVIVDANGADYFDVFATTAVSACSIGNYWFGAFPLTGMQGPTGGAPGPVVGDFYAAGANGAGMWAPGSINTWTTAKPSTNILGNSGGYYNGTTGAYTPPAGRYRLFAELSFNSTASNLIGQLRWRKNGVAIPNTDTAQNTTGASLWGSITAEVMVDANGSDTFDLQVQCNVLMSNAYGYMGAFPTQGMVGPQGPPGPLPAGALSLYQEVVLSANAASMQVSWPSGVRKIEIEYLGLNNGNAPDTIDFRAMLNGVPNTASGYSTQYVYGSGTSPVAGTITATVWQALGGMIITKGTFRPAVTSAQSYVEHVQVGNSASVLYALEAYHSGPPSANMNGILLFNAGATLFAPGSFLRVYVVP